MSSDDLEHRLKRLRPRSVSPAARAAIDERLRSQPTVKGARRGRRRAAVLAAALGVALAALVVWRLVPTPDQPRQSGGRGEVAAEHPRDTPPDVALAPLPPASERPSLRRLSALARQSDRALIGYLDGLETRAARNELRPPLRAWPVKEADFLEERTDAQ